MADLRISEDYMYVNFRICWNLFWARVYFSAAIGLRMYLSSTEIGRRSCEIKRRCWSGGMNL